MLCFFLTIYQRGWFLIDNGYVEAIVNSFSIFILELILWIKLNKIDSLEEFKNLSLKNRNAGFRMANNKDLNPPFCGGIQLD